MCSTEVAAEQSYIRPTTEQLLLNLLICPSSYNLVAQPMGSSELLLLPYFGAQELDSWGQHEATCSLEVCRWVKPNCTGKENLVGERRTLLASEL